VHGVNAAVRTHVDFHAVEPQHAAVHERLENWARWARGSSTGPATSPMFRLYRPTQQWRQVVEIGRPVNTADAIKVQRAMVRLPEAHRHALAWCYIVRSNPRGCAQRLGESMEGLALLIRCGRDMLVRDGL
jgi:hypothetical protein